MRDFLVPSSISFIVDDNGCTVLLNTSTGRWHVLNTTGGTIFHALRDGTPIDEIIDSLVATNLHVPMEQIARETYDLIDALAKRGLLVPNPTYMRQRASVEMTLNLTPLCSVKPLDRFVALAALSLAALLLVLPFRIAIASVKLLKERWATTPAQRHEVQAALIAAHTLGRHFPGRLACVQLSLTCVLILAIRRRRADWAFGTSTDPLNLHSWVEISGEPIYHPLDEALNRTYRRVLYV
jgi:hypothetical protein